MDTVPASSFKEDAGISRPGPARDAIHLSACIDPKTLDPYEPVVLPSGKRTDYDTWLQNPERPSSVRERKEAIIRRVRMHTAATSRTRVGKEVNHTRLWRWLKPVLMMFVDPEEKPELSLSN